MIGDTIIYDMDNGQRWLRSSTSTQPASSPQGYSHSHSQSHSHSHSLSHSHSHTSSHDHIHYDDDVRQSFQPALGHPVPHSIRQGSVFDVPPGYRTTLRQSVSVAESPFEPATPSRDLNVRDTSPQRVTRSQARNQLQVGLNFECGVFLQYILSAE